MGRHGFPGIFPAKVWHAAAFIAMVLRKASALMRISNYILYIIYIYIIIIIESVDSISKDERGFPLTQYITNGRISRGGYTFTHFKHHHSVLWLISYSMSV